MKAVFDASEVINNVKRIAKNMSGPPGQKLVFEMLAKLKYDADNVVPKTPHKGGDLRGDYEISVKGFAKKIAGKLIFKMPYAWRWHEVMKAKRTKWSEGGVGRKYVETKMRRFKSEYLKLLGRGSSDIIKRSLK